MASPPVSLLDVGPDSIVAGGSVWGHPVPDLGLDPVRQFEFRVYLLLCATKRGATCYYVGFVHASKVGERMMAHEKGKVHWTSVNRPSAVVFLVGCAHPATEGMLFNALLPLVPSSNYRLLGGWVGTGVAPPPIQVHQFREQSRMLSGQCMTCGSKGHGSDSCKKAPPAVRYLCSGCGADIYICGSGRSVSVAAQVGESCLAPVRHGNRLGPPVPVQPKAQPTANAKGTTQTDGGQAAAGAVSPVDPGPVTCPPRKRSTNPNSGLVVLHAGVELSVLSWYLGKEATRPQRARALAALVNQSAWKIEGGAPRSLVQAGYAKSSSPPPFVPFGSVTLVCVDSPTSLQHLLIPLSVLEEAFPRARV